MFGPAGGLISSTLFRWSVGLVPILFVLLSAFWLRQEMTGTSGVIDGFPPSTQDIVIVLSVAVLAVIGMMAVAVAFVMLRLGRTLLDSGAVGASAAMGVGPGVAYWVGQGQHDDATVAEHAAVRIKVPSDLGTLTFDADADVQQRASGSRACGDRSDTPGSCRTEQRPDTARRRDPVRCRPPSRGGERSTEEC